MDVTTFKGIDLRFMHQLSPEDAEMSFNFDLEGGSLLRARSSVGAPCVNINGVHQNCSVAAGEGVVSAHTHPRGNRVSGADLKVSVDLHPRFGGVRRASAVLAPRGVFFYGPSPALLETWDAYTDAEQVAAQEAWTQYGKDTQSVTQTGDLAAWLEHYRAEGFHVNYTPWADLKENVAVRLL